MSLDHIVTSILNGQNHVKVDPDLKIINHEMLKTSKFKPICKRTVAYIVSIILINEKNQVCLVQEAKASCRGQWYLPAGRMEPNEDLYMAAIRECKEETGYIVDPFSLCCIEVGESGLWYRFTFVGLIVGDSLKTIEQADSESLQANWFDIDLLSDKQFRKQLRSSDFINLVNIVSKYYKSYNIYSTSKVAIDDFKNQNNNNLIIPSLISHNNILFTFVLLNENFSSYLICEEESKQKLPSVVCLPSLYEETMHHSLNFAIESILLPNCFENPKYFEYSLLNAAAVNYDGKTNQNEETRDGIQIIIILRTFTPKAIQNVSKNDLQTRATYKWQNFEENCIDSIKQKLKNDTNFITVLINF